MESVATEISILEFNATQNRRLQVIHLAHFSCWAKSYGSTRLMVRDFHGSLCACVNAAGYFRSHILLSDSKSIGDLKKVLLPTKAIPLCLRAAPQYLSS